MCGFELYFLEDNDCSFHPSRGLTRLRSSKHYGLQADGKLPRASSGTPFKIVRKLACTRYFETHRQRLMFTKEKDLFRAEANKVALSLRKEVLAGQGVYLCEIFWDDLSYAKQEADMHRVITKTVRHSIAWY